MSTWAERQAKLGLLPGLRGKEQSRELLDKEISLLEIKLLDNN